MYLDFFHFGREPFHITPDPYFFYPSRGHREALAALIYGVGQRKGFISLTGEIGVGKTTILRSFIEQIDRERTKVIYLLNSSISFGDLLEMLLQEFGAAPESGNTFMMVNQLHRILIDQFRHGRNVVLIVDEAQHMPVETLERLRMLSNLETSTDKLVQIVLAGQPDLERVLGRNELLQLRQRIAVRATVVPLTKKESLDYIRHRLAAAAANDTTVFTRGALNRIVKRAGGIPRTINILCDNALVTGYGYQKTPVDSGIVREVIGDLKGRRKQVLLRWGVVFSALLLLVAGVFLILPRVQTGMKGPAPPHEYQTGLSPGAEEPVHSQGDGVTARTVENEPGGGNAPAGPAAGDAPLPQKEMFPEKKSATVRTVKRGDTLYRMVQDVYGSSDYGLLTHVWNSNPGIKDVNEIKAGEEIRFPEIPAKKVEGRQ